MLICERKTHNWESQTYFIIGSPKVFYLWGSISDCRSTTWIFLMPLKLMVDFTHEINYSLSETSHFPPVIEGSWFFPSYLARKLAFLLIENNLENVEMLAFVQTRSTHLSGALQDTILGATVTWEIGGMWIVINWHQYKLWSPVRSGLPLHMYDQYILDFAGAVLV